LARQTGCGDEAAPTSGLVAYQDQTPVGWCALAPRIATSGAGNSPIPWAGRAKDKTETQVWAITCMISRPGYRGQGVTYALARAAVDAARRAGATAIEAYAMLHDPGITITWGELHVGSHNALAAAGFTVVSRPTARRVVMRVGFAVGLSAPNTASDGHDEAS
jgi:GNAT superfamily N-acetyltransferase